MATETVKPLILISNDDGWQAKGINTLVDMISDLGDIIVCAPEGGRSGKSRAFSTEPVMLRRLEDRGKAQIWACSGTPVDCIKLAYAHLCPRKPALVLGGINHGDNGSTNSHYSGTVGIVIEGAMKGIPSIAFSHCSYDENANFEPMRTLVRSLVSNVLDKGLPNYVCLNVNFPDCEEVLGTRVCRMAHGHWRNEVEKRTHPHGSKEYFWMAGYYQNDEPDAEDTDNWALSHGYASITPMTVDATAYETIDYVKTLL